RAHELADLDGEALEARGEPVGALGAAAMMARQAPAVAPPRREAAAELDQLVAAVDARDERCESGEAPRPEEHHRIVRARPGRRNVALQSRASIGKLRRREDRKSTRLNSSHVA